MPTGKQAPARGRHGQSPIGQSKSDSSTTATPTEHKISDHIRDHHVSKVIKAASDAHSQIIDRNPQNRQTQSSMPFDKYRAFAPIDLPDRTWPDKVITKAPLWCSVDLRDGNQSLIEPMGPDRKWRMFTKLVEMGFKEIEVGFPAASEADFNFVREIIEQGAIPDDVTIQVLVQCRRDLIDKTYESLRGAKQAIVHFYNSTATLQREVVFRLDTDGIKQIATDAAAYCKTLESSIPDTHIRYEYSPESFTGTELAFAKEICDAVVEVINPSIENKIILNLPATVEMATANTYADMIEWMHRNLNRRDEIILSLHPHNDRGTGVAAAEFGLMAGADRVEGTLFGNGERSGNVDVINIAMNMFSQGVDPQLDIGDINEIRRVTEYCNQLPVHPRHPYVGDLVYTSFAGSHQDAIKKGFEALSKSAARFFEVPYIPVDPSDVGRSYEDVVRVSSQSGKGGVAYLLKTKHQFDLPCRMQIEFARSIQKICDATGKEISAQQIFNEFAGEYLDVDGPFVLHGYESAEQVRDMTALTARVSCQGEQMLVQGEGSGVPDAFVSGLRRILDKEDLRVLDYHEQLSQGSEVDAIAVAYVEMAVDGHEVWGCGLHTDITEASMRAIISAINRAAK